MANKNKSNNGSENAKQAKYSKQMSDVSIYFRRTEFKKLTFCFSFKDIKDYSSFKVVLFYCSLIVFLPVITFFCLKGVVLDRFFTLTELRSNIYSAVGAVLALHFALALYIYRAYFGSSTTSRTKAD